VLKGIGAVFIVLIGILILGVIIAGNVSRQAGSPPTAVQESTPKKPPTEAEMIALRREYAKVIDKELLESGIESTTTASGSKATILIITDALAGRVRAHTLSSNGKLFEQLRTLQFQTLKYTDGYDETFTWELAPKKSK
jgi:Na+-transporting methylmalonyl-CoA/oxaloacetate decarboxylase gamma subunit